MRDTLSGYPRAFWVLFAGTLVNRLGLVVLPFLTLYLTGERGYSIEQATLVVSLYGVGAFAAGPLGGALSDRYGRRSVLIGSLLGGAVLMMAIPRMGAFAPLAGLVLAFGLVGEMYRPVVSAAVSDLVPAHRFARAFALIYWAINLGAAIGPSMGGVLAERVGYTALFTVDAATMIVFALVIAVGVPETRPEAPEADPAEGPLASGVAEALVSRTDGIRRALRDPRLVGLSLATFGVGTAFVQAFSTLPLVMEADGLSHGRLRPVHRRQRRHRRSAEPAGGAVGRDSAGAGASGERRRADRRRGRDARFRRHPGRARAGRVVVVAGRDRVHPARARAHRAHGARGSARNVPGGQPCRVGDGEDDWPSVRRRPCWPSMGRPALWSACLAIGLITAILILVLRMGEAVEPSVRASDM